jgi:anti-sigma B factor antagonist
VPQPSVVPISTAPSLRAEPLPFTCTWETAGPDTAWMHVAGELDRATSPKLAQTVHDARLHARLLVLDLRQVSFIESSALHVILDATADAREAGGRLMLVRGPAHVDRALTLTGARKELEVFDLLPTEPPARALEHLLRRDRAAA